MVNQKKKMGLAAKMLIGMVLGIIVGIIVGPSISIIKPFGTAFVNLLKMCMVPIVFVSITLSIANVDDLKQFGRIGIKTFLFYCVTTAVAAAVSITYTSIIRPGIGFGTDISTKAVERTIPKISETLLSIIPTNIVAALANAHLVSIIFFSIMFGIALALIGDKKLPIVRGLESLNDAIFKMINICLKYAPVGVFALMANMAGSYGIDVIKTLGKFLLTDYLGFITQLVVIYGIILGICKINLFKFLYRTREAIITAATTLSSAATVPVELNISESHMGVPKDVAGFMFPFGATVNQNGTAINITCCVLFSAQVYGMKFTATELIILIGLALISSIGCAGIPAGGTVFTLMILTQFGIPSEAFAMIIAAYSLVDLGSTTMNICGDMVGAVYVCRSEKLLNEKVWESGYNPEEAKASSLTA